MSRGGVSNFFGELEDKRVKNRTMYTLCLTTAERLCMVDALSIARSHALLEAEDGHIDAAQLTQLQAAFDHIEGELDRDDT